MTTSCSSPVRSSLPFRGIRRGGAASDDDLTGTSAVATLLAAGADLNLVAADGRAALHAAAAEGNLATVARLLAAGARKGVRDRHGRRASEVKNRKNIFLLFFIH